MKTLCTDGEVPRDVSYVNLLLENPNAVAGFLQNSERASELAVEMLAAQLQHNLFGIPAIFTATSVGGEWIDGNSLATTGGSVGVREASPSPLEKPDLVA